MNLDDARNALTLDLLTRIDALEEIYLKASCLHEEKKDPPSQGEPPVRYFGEVRYMRV